ncbi:MAG: hypothetical protein K2N64_05185 [Anaeroplasmataceae bacterium]|nr:hypothetical protein [Anaeroplasmataceae bacterium]
MKLEKLYSILNKVLGTKVFYGINVYDNEDNASMPYIVYQEISKRPIGYHDDFPIRYQRTIQITLVTKRKDTLLEQKLEKQLLKKGIFFSVLTETINSDKSVNRIYEIKMEE